MYAGVLFHSVHLAGAMMICFNKSCLLNQIVLKIEESSIDADQVLNGIGVIYGDETLPQLYEKSEVSLRHLPGQEGIVCSC